MFTYAVSRDPAAAGFVLVSDRFLAVASGESDGAATRLWRRLGEGGATLASVITALDTDADAPVDVALVELVDAPSRTVEIAVRGQARVELSGGRDVRLGGEQSRWAQSTAREVAGMALALPSSSRRSLGSLPLARGVARSDLLEWGTPTPPPAASATPAPAAAEPAAHSETAAVTVDPPLETLRRDRLPALDLDDRTELRRAARQRPEARPVLRIGSDRVLELDVPLVLGRSPRPAAHPGTRLVSVASPQREISGAHLQVHLEGDRLVARDLESTNGTIVREPDGASLLLRHGASVRLKFGSSLDLGDGIVAVFGVSDTEDA